MSGLGWVGGGETMAAHFDIVEGVWGVTYVKARVSMKGKGHGYNLRQTRVEEDYPFGPTDQREKVISGH